MGQRKRDRSVYPHTQLFTTSEICDRRSYLLYYLYLKYCKIWLYILLYYRKDDCMQKADIC